MAITASSYRFFLYIMVIKYHISLPLLTRYKYGYELDYFKFHITCAYPCYCFLHSHQQQLIIIQTYRTPCSSSHQWTMQITRQTTFKYTKKTQKKHRCSVRYFGGKLKEIALARTSGVRGGACNEPVIRRGEVPTLPIQRVGLTPDVPCLQCTSWMQVWVGVDD